MLPPVVHRRLHLYLFSRLYRHTSASASRWVPLVQLVVAFPGALASPCHRASALCLGFCHSPHLHLVAPSHSLVGCRFTWSLTPPPLVATPPGDASCRTPLVRLVCRIAIARRLIILVVVMFSLITSLLPVHLRLSIRKALGVVRGARPSPARPPPHCCPCCACPHARPLPARGLSRHYRCHGRPSPGRGPMRERVQMDDEQCPRTTTIGVGPKSQLCDPVVTRLTQN
jgi:hypothetical protein